MERNVSISVISVKEFMRMTGIGRNTTLKLCATPGFPARQEAKFCKWYIIGNRVDDWFLQDGAMKMLEEVADPCEVIEFRKKFAE